MHSFDQNQKLIQLETLEIQERKKKKATTSRSFLCGLKEREVYQKNTSLSYLTDQAWGEKDQKQSRKNIWPCPPKQKLILFLFLLKRRNKNQFLP